MNDKKPVQFWMSEQDLRDLKSRCGRNGITMQVFLYNLFLDHWQDQMASIERPNKQENEDNV